ncbi:MAG: B12-binding domain-containing radical SAM protein [Cyanobacteria bacterium REEB444]|nr:B12-binding domain-containing radical SAM protein [Cyanobacteria bacterium REEB444]
MTKQIDVLFVNPDSSAKAYQDLAILYSAIETPTWALLLAQACRAKYFQVSILDCDAERLSLSKSIERIEEVNARLVCFVVYGQNPNSGTTSMIGATTLASYLKKCNPNYPICFVGSHISALPKQVLAYSFVDFVLLNEGVYAIQNLLKSDLRTNLNKIKGIGFKNEGQIILNAPEILVPQERMDIDMPGYAWDLLPYNEKPLDLYRSHFWHAEFNHQKRTPFAALYTSLGCRFACDFCMINIINRVDNGDNVNSSNSKGMRFWSPEFMIREFEKLANLGVHTIRICDEMFFLDKRYFQPLIDGLIDHNLDLRMWAYSRIDTVREQYLESFQRAGISWLALGIEAGSQLVRKEVSKGTFEEVNIRKVCRNIRDHNINIISNYIFGFPDDNLETMQQTLDLALELNTEMANMYPCQALPGSPLYNKALSNNWDLPDTFEGFAFLSYESFPLRTKYCTSAEVLSFRDQAWQTYFANPNYLDLVEKKFGVHEKKNVQDMASIKLKRKLLGD